MKRLVCLLLVLAGCNTTGVIGTGQANDGGNGMTGADMAIVVCTYDVDTFDHCVYGK